MSAQEIAAVAHAAATTSEQAARWRRNEALGHAETLMGQASAAARAGDLGTTKRLCQRAYSVLMDGERP